MRIYLQNIEKDEEYGVINHYEDLQHYIFICEILFKIKLEVQGHSTYFVNLCFLVILLSEYLTSTLSQVFHKYTKFINPWNIK